DPRFALQANPGEGTTMGGGDVRVAGRAIEVEDAAARAAYAEEVEPPEPFHLFRTELTEVVRTYVEDEKYLVVQVWKPGEPVRIKKRTGDRGNSLPLDGPRRLGGDVQDDQVDVPHLVGDAGGDLPEDVVGQPRPVGGHGVLGGHRAQDDRVAVGPAVALDADAADVREQDHRALPDVTVETGRGELLAGDGVGLAQEVEPFLGDLGDAPHAEAGTGQRLPRDDLVGQAEFLADHPHLVLEELAQRFDQLDLEVLGQPAHVVVGLDVGGAGAAAGLHDVRVQGALDEELHGRALVGDDLGLGLLEDPD